MKKLIFAITAMAAVASCSKESSEDVSIASTQTPMEFTTYAGSASTKGTPIDTNDTFKGNAFEVSSYFYATDTNNDGKYFDFSTVQYKDNAWENQDVMYWPNESGTLYFGAYYPSGAAGIATATTEYTNTAGAHSLVLDYTVQDAVGDQEDLMYAVKDCEYTHGVTATSVDLHFKHALTQIAFTATKAENLVVTVTSLKICNVRSGGTFTATKVTDDSSTANDDGAIVSADVDSNLDDSFGEWSAVADSDYENYEAVMDDTSITVGDTVTALTEETDALMLVPQELTAWVKGVDSSDAYLAIGCVITHQGGEAAIIDGTIYVPFDTTGIVYSGTTGTNGWKSGYKITYNLVFGGGYTIPGGTTDPEPGETPDDLPDADDDLVETLRAITYTTTVDEWIPVAKTVDL